MIKLTDILNELNESEYKDLTLKDARSAILTAFNKKFGYLNLYMKESDYMYISTDRNPERASMFGDGNPKHYYLALSCYNDGEDLTVVVTNATAGPFKGKGLTSDIIKAVFEVAEKKLGMFKRKVLFIDTDASGGAWKSMAQKLGVEYEASKTSHDGFKQDIVTVKYDASGIDTPGDPTM